MEKMLEWQYSDFFAADKPDFIISEDRVEANRVIMRHRSYNSLPEEIEMGSLQIAIIDLLTVSRFFRKFNFSHRLFYIN